MTPINQRIVSIDFLRGLTIALMIVVNNPGDWGNLFLPFSHAHWNGVTSTDLIFPFFIFIVGASIAFSMLSKKASTENHSQLMMKIIKRGIIIFLLGLLKDNFPYMLHTDEGLAFKPLDTWRIMGVLQRIGLVYLFAGLIFIKTNWKQQVGITLSILLGYWALLQIEIDGAYILELDKYAGGNLVTYIDYLILGDNHMWQQIDLDSGRMLGWEPEGLLSTLPAIATCLIGVLAGQWIKRESAILDKISNLFAIGGALTVLALLWNLTFPFNKGLWTSSYVLYAGGIALMSSGFCMWLMDYKGYNKVAKPFVIFGSNATVAYLMAELVASLTWFIQIDGVSLNQTLAGLIKNLIPHPQLASHTYAFLWMIPFFLILKWMYNKKIFVKV
jgi:predicted acyltransferase